MYKIVSSTGELMLVLITSRRAIWYAREHSAWGDAKGGKIWIVRSELDRDLTIGYALNGEYFSNQYARTDEKEK